MVAKERLRVITTAVFGLIFLGFLLGCSSAPTPQPTEAPVSASRHIETRFGRIDITTLPNEIEGCFTDGCFPARLEDVSWTFPGEEVPFEMSDINLAASDTFPDGQPFENCHGFTVNTTIGSSSFFHWIQPDQMARLTTELIRRDYLESLPPGTRPIKAPKGSWAIFGPGFVHSGIVTSIPYETSGDVMVQSVTGGTGTGPQLLPTALFNGVYGTTQVNLLEVKAP